MQGLYSFEWGNEWRVDVNLYEDGRDLFKDNIREFTWRDWGKPQELQDKSGEVQSLSFPKRV